MDVRDMYHGNAFMYRAGDKLNKTAFMLYNIYVCVTVCFCTVVLRLV